MKWNARRWGEIEKKNVQIRNRGKWMAKEI